MLNEPASTPDDRPVLRSTAVPATSYDALHEQLRQMVETVLTIERETFASDDDGPEYDLNSLSGVLALTPDSELTAVFEGHLKLDSEEAYTRLDRLFDAMDYMPLFRIVNGRHVILAVKGRIRPTPRAWWPNLALFIATLFSVLLVGTMTAINEIAYDNQRLAAELAANIFTELWRGLPYAGSILLILGAHEFGHYFAARRHKLAVTLPYFIPLPFISAFGTLGAFIQLREPMRNRKTLLDVGAAGPLAGLIVAIPILLIGLSTAPVGPITPGGSVEGNSVIYALAKILIKGHFLPDGEFDVYVNQMTWAGWTGLLVTALNLIPIGQLDGGHILYSLIGEKARRLYYPVLAVMIALVFVSEAWLLWVILLFLFGRMYATPLDMITPLDSRRRAIALFALVVFLLVFVPVPLSEVAAEGTPIPRESVYMLPAIGIVLAQRFRRSR
jgi:Zn-dependent protease